MSGPAILVGPQSLDSTEDQQALVDAMNALELGITAGPTDLVEIAESETWVPLAIGLWLVRDVADKTISVVLDLVRAWAMERLRERQSRPTEAHLYGSDGVTIIRRVKIDYDDRRSRL